MIALSFVLISRKAWDYVVVWKYGNDPTRYRFIEWMGCCCGGNGGIVTTEEVIGEEEKVEVCRDTRFQHGVATKTCLALSQLPFAMSLYSGSVSFFLTFDCLGLFGLAFFLASFCNSRI